MVETPEAISAIRQATESAPCLPAPDRLWRHAPAPLVARYNVLGIPLEIAANDHALLELAAECFGGWETTEPALAGKPLRLELLLQEVIEPSPPEASALLLRAREDYLLLSVGQSLGMGHRSSGFACAFLTPSLLANRPLAQTCFVETLGMFLVCHYRRATLHAAAVAQGGCCVLLTGRDGAGKSTLAYACLRAGFRLISEDIVFAEACEAGITVWGVPWRLHLLPDAVRFFPELAGAARICTLQGETKLRVAVREMRPGAAVPRMPVQAVLSLSRAEGPKSRLRPAEPACLLRALTDFKDTPFLDREATRAAAERLLAGRRAHLEVGSDLEQAAERVRQWLEGEEGR